MKKTVILQSGYIPWKGYFDLMNSADLFILYDDLQYTKKDWRNRNRVKTRNGLRWLTIPVQRGEGTAKKKIWEAKAAGQSWRRKHWNILQNSYHKMLYFDIYRDIFEKLYIYRYEENLTDINITFINEITKILGIETEILVWPNEERRPEGRTERILRVCRETGTTEYISGPAAKAYIEPDLFRESGIRLTWYDYSGYPEYGQPFPPFEHKVSVLDLLFSAGPEAPAYLKSFAS